MATLKPVIGMASACLVAAAITATPAMAAEQELSRSTYKQLSDARDLMQAREYDKAVLKLESLLAGTEKRYDRAIVLQTQAYALLESGEQASAINAFEQSLALKALPAEAAQQVQHTVGQLYAADGQYAKAAKALEAWFDGNAGQAKATDYALLANVYAQTRSFTKGIAAISRAIRLESQPNKQYYDLLLALTFEAERYDQAARALEDMIGIWPDETGYWTQLANVYLNDNKASKAHTVMKLAYEKGLLTTESDLKSLVQLAMSVDLPFHAARVLQDGMQNGRIASNNEHWELLAVAWARAKETDQAIDAYGKVAQLSGSGEAHLRQAELYMQNDEWQKVITATDQALKLGKLKSPGRAHLLRGMAYTQMREYPQGLNAFGEARRYDDTASTATRWVQYIRQRQQVES